MSERSSKGPSHSWLAAVPILILAGCGDAHRVYDPVTLEFDTAAAVADRERGEVVVYRETKTHDGVPAKIRVKTSCYLDDETADVWPEEQPEAEISCGMREIENFHYTARVVSEDIRILAYFNPELLEADLSIFGIIDRKTDKVLELLEAGGRPLDRHEISARDPKGLRLKDEPVKLEPATIPTSRIDFDLEFSQPPGRQGNWRAGCTISIPIPPEFGFAGHYEVSYGGNPQRVSVTAKRDGTWCMPHTYGLEDKIRPKVFRAGDDRAYLGSREKVMIPFAAPAKRSDREDEETWSDEDGTQVDYGDGEEASRGEDDWAEDGWSEDDEEWLDEDDESGDGEDG
ncbi:MAG: hypothetical protein AAGM22_22735 [Acidobacteriota bacterium]